MPQIKGSVLTLDGIVRANIGVFSNDPVFRQVTEQLLPQHGLIVHLILKPEVSYETGLEVYLVDLHEVKEQDYETLVASVEQLSERNSEIKLVVLPTQNQYYSPAFNPIRQAGVKRLIDIVKRPETVYSEGVPLDSYKTDVSKVVDVDVLDVLNRMLSKPHIIKIGGSIFDLLEQYPNVLRNLLIEIGELHRTYPLILTSGGGPRQDLERSFKRRLGISDEVFEGISRGVLEKQAGTITGLLRDIGVDADYVAPEQMHLLDVSGNYLRRHVPVVSLSNGAGIPASQSDAHTLNIADYFALPEVVFAKNTDGVYLWDPNTPKDRLLASMMEARLGVAGIERNQIIPHISAGDILAGRISRFGLDTSGAVSDNHVIETSALNYLLERARYVQRIHVVNGTKSGTLTSALKGEQVGSYILKG